MFHQSLQHAVWKSMFVKRVAVIVGAGLVATIATAMVGWIPAPRMAVIPAWRTTSSLRAPANRALQSIGRLRCFMLGPDTSRLNLQRPTAATGGSTFALRAPAACALPALFAELGNEQNPTGGYRDATRHTSLAAATRVRTRAWQGTSPYGGEDRSGPHAADPRSGGSTAIVDAQQAAGLSSEEHPDAA